MPCETDLHAVLKKMDYLEKLLVSRGLHLKSSISLLLVLRSTRYGPLRECRVACTCNLLLPLLSHAHVQKLHSPSGWLWNGVEEKVDKNLAVSGAATTQRQQIVDLDRTKKPSGTAVIDMVRPRRCWTGIRKKTPHPVKHLRLGLALRKTWGQLSISFLKTLRGGEKWFKKD